MAALFPTALCTQLYLTVMLEQDVPAQDPCQTDRCSACEPCWGLHRYEHLCAVCGSSGYAKEKNVK